MTGTSSDSNQSNPEPATPSEGAAPQPGLSKSRTPTAEDTPPPRSGAGSNPSSFGHWMQYVGALVAAQVPFFLSLTLYYNLAAGAQGIALAEREGWPSLLVTRFAGIYVVIAGAFLTFEALERRWLAHISHAAYRTPWVVVMAILALVYALAPGPPESTWWGYGLLFIIAASAVCCTVGLPLAFAKFKEDFPITPVVVVSAVIVLVPILLGSLFTHYSTTTPLGPLSALLIGLMALSLGCQLLFITLPALWGSSLWALVVAVAVGLAVAADSPMQDHLNPLLTVSGNVAPCATSRGPFDESDRPLAVTAEGGGMRAAYWTAVSLQRLSDDLGEEFTKRIRVMSGVSGGSLGLATWLAAQELDDPRARLPAIQRFLSEDFLTPLLLGMLFVDVPGLALPIPTHRGDYFERAMATRWKEQTGHDFFTKRACALTYNEGQSEVYFNATDAQSGNPVVLGNRLAPAMPGADRSSKLNQVIQERWADITVAQAVHTSARFFYVSPHPDFTAPAKVVASALGAVGDGGDPDKDARLAVLVDGGYFDNSALGPVIELLQRGSGLPTQEERDRAATFAKRWSVLHISNDWQRRCANSTSEKPAVPKPEATRALRAACEQQAAHYVAEAEKKARWGWATRPIEAIFSVRGAHSLQRLNELRATLRTLHGAEDLPITEMTLPAPSRFIRERFEDEVPLVWTLSTQHRQTLDTHSRAVMREVVGKLRASAHAPTGQGASAPRSN